jgi:DNA repair protein RecN (Recombination protein N)
MNAHFYLKNLVIQNFATFKNQSISFRPGFNAIVGETGSGKSLVLDALQLILGGRSDKKMVRKDTDFSLIEATFFCQDPKIKEFLASEGYPIEESELIIKRLIYKTGTTKTFVNHSSCTAQFLSHFSRRYIDLVGQFENQKLLSESYQLHLLDHFAKTEPLLQEYQDQFYFYKKACKEKEELESSKNQREQRLDYLTFQLQEIEKLNPSSQEEDDLLKKKSSIVNMEKSQKLLAQIQGAFEGEDQQSGLNSSLKFLLSLFRKNPDIFQDDLETLSEIDDRLQRFQQSLFQKLGEDYDPQELEGVLDRLDFYQRLKKKFGGTVEAILQHQVDFLKEKSQLEEVEFNLETIDQKIAESYKTLDKLAQKLHVTRKSYSKKLSQELTLKVRQLKMTGATLRIEVEETPDFHENGRSRVTFVAETNQGEGFYKIKDIASGGELSRILLSLRQILSSCDSISIFLFDEIDTGIGGETANSIGRALQEVSVNGQVIAITHLPQIAQFAETLIIVQKETQAKDSEKRTESSVKEVIGKMILKEVKQMAQLN